MEEKMLKQNEKKLNKIRKNYTPPSLTVYGRLTEVTGAGGNNTPENSMNGTPTPGMRA